MGFFFFICNTELALKKEGFHLCHFFFLMNFLHSSHIV